MPSDVKPLLPVWANSLLTCMLTYKGRKVSFNRLSDEMDAYEARRCGPSRKDLIVWVSVLLRECPSLVKG
ncbi:MAG: hypothetical protein ACP5T5_04645, partial [Thermoprotei archaeon]